MAYAGIFPNPKWGPGTGRQVICKDDFAVLERAIMTQGQNRLHPPLVYIDDTTVCVKASPDSPAYMAFDGVPNIFNPVAQVHSGLCDEKIRGIVADVNCNFAIAGGLWGDHTEKESQWYAVYAIAADLDSDFTLSALPFCRAKSEASGVITLRNNADGADIGYGFETDALAGGKIYMITGAEKGKIRTILANNNTDSDSVGATITYDEAEGELTLTQGDWFMILPPATNFRWVGDIFNDTTGAIGDLVQFIQDGNQVFWNEPVTIHAPNSTPSCEDIRCASPLAIAMGVTNSSGGTVVPTICHPDGSNLISIGIDMGASVIQPTFVEAPIKNCRYKGTGYADANLICLYFKYAA